MDECIGTIIFMAVLFSYVIWALFFRGKPRKLKYTEEISNRIDKLYYINQQIKQIDKLKTDADLADRDHHYRFSFERETILGENIAADIWVDGNSPLSAQTAALLDARKKELLRSLFTEMFKLPHRKRRDINVIQTTDIYGGGDELNV